jgi:hypothetical protein
MSASAVAKATGRKRSERGTAVGAAASMTQDLKPKGPGRGNTKDCVRASALCADFFAILSGLLIRKVEERPIRPTSRRKPAAAPPSMQPAPRNWPKVQWMARRAAALIRYVR